MRFSHEDWISLKGEGHLSFKNPQAIPPKLSQGNDASRTNEDVSPTQNEPAPPEKETLSRRIKVGPREVSVKALVAISVTGIVLIGVVSSCDDSSDSRSSSPPRPSSSSGGPDIASHAETEILQGIQEFLAEHPEFGSATTTESVPDWAQGKRHRVRFTNGRNLLFYLKDGKIVTVYEWSDTEGRKKILGGAYTAEYARDVDRQSEGELPDYTGIKAINLLAGGKNADILVPRFSANTPRATRKKVAFATLKKEGLRSLSMYSTRKAYKADYSSSFAEEHPKASNGFLGSISMHSGEFSD